MEFTDKPLEPFGQTLLDMAIPTQLSLKNALVFRIVKTLTTKRYLPWTGSHRAELCFDEAITNAMVHGNRLDPALKVHVSLFGDGSRWGVIVEDEGQGFKPEAVPSPDAPDFFLREAGRGILLIDNYVDELKYNARGNRLRMIRRAQPEPEAAEAHAAIETVEVMPEGAGPVILSEQNGAMVAEICVNRLTEEGLADVLAALQPAFEKPALVLDLSHVEYLSSVGISALVSMHKKFTANKGRLVLAGMQPSVRDILTGAHLLRLFTVAPDRAAGVKEVGRQA